MCASWRAVKPKRELAGVGALSATPRFQNQFVAIHPQRHRLASFERGSESLLLSIYVNVDKTASPLNAERERSPFLR